MVLKFFKRLILLLAGTWSLVIFAVMGLWLVVSVGLFPIDSKFTALGFFPPYGFILFLFPALLLLLLIKDWKRFGWVALIYLLFFITFGDFNFTGRKSEPLPETLKTQKLTVAALNLRYFSYGLENVAEGIKQMEADVYLLSENVITDDQKEELERRIKPMTFHMGRQEGTAIISKYPVLSFKEVELPSRQASLFEENEVNEQHKNPYRSFVHAVVDVNGVPTHAISIRFLAGRAKDRSPKEVLRWGFYVLDSQLKELDFFINYINKLDGPVIFGGDLNATPSSYVVKEISKIAVDTYLEDHIWGNFTFWTNFPSYARLDYIFSKGMVQPVRSELPDIVVSDHYAVFTEFLIPTQLPAAKK